MRIETLAVLLCVMVWLIEIVVLFARWNAPRRALLVWALGLQIVTCIVGVWVTLSLSYSGVGEGGLFFVALFVLLEMVLLLFGAVATVVLINYHPSKTRRDKERDFSTSSE
jgi:hypothetical protein